MSRDRDIETEENEEQELCNEIENEEEVGRSILEAEELKKNKPLENIRKKTLSPRVKQVPSN